MKFREIYHGTVEGGGLVLPDHLADWDVWEYWECEVYHSMEQELTDDDTLWVIGAEHGALAALWSRLAGDTVLIEPSPEFWRNIRLTWEANDLAPPTAVVPAFLADEMVGVATTYRDGLWPASAYPDEECPAQAYRYVFNEQHALEIPTTTVDTLVARGVPAPTALTCDTEGAEVLIVSGAREMLAKHDVKCWMSLHPDLIERDYPGHTVQDVHNLFAELGYHGEHLATDHEEHWLFTRSS